MGTIAPRALARIEHSEALLAALRQRVTELKLTHEIIDHLGGFPLGYASKLLSNPPQRRLGHFSLFTLLQVLGLDIVLVENPLALEALRNPQHLRRQKLVLRQPRITIFTPDFRRVNGVKGAAIRNAKLSAKQRIALARRAARARWAKHRANGQASAADVSPRSS